MSHTDKSDKPHAKKSSPSSGKCDDCGKSKKRERSKSPERRPCAPAIVILQPSTLSIAGATTSILGTSTGATIPFLVTLATSGPELAEARFVTIVTKPADGVTPSVTVTGKLIDPKCVPLLTGLGSSSSSSSGFGSLFAGLEIESLERTADAERRSDKDCKIVQRFVIIPVTGLAPGPADVFFIDKFGKLVGIARLTLTA